MQFLSPEVSTDAVAEGGGGLTREKVTRNGSQVESTLGPELKYIKKIISDDKEVLCFKNFNMVRSILQMEKITK